MAQINSGYTLARINDFIGKEVGVSDWIPIDQARIDAFSDVTEDHQWIHKKGPQAERGPFGAPIAHGLLLLSLTVKLAKEAGALPADASMCVNYGYDKIRFPVSVKAGQRIRCRATLLSATEKGPGRILLNTQYSIEVEGEQKPCVVADCLGLFYRNS